jgi:hypothetical protein
VSTGGDDAALVAAGWGVDDDLLADAAAEQRL